MPQTRAKQERQARIAIRCRRFSAKGLERLAASHLACAALLASSPRASAVSAEADASQGERWVEDLQAATAGCAALALSALGERSAPKLQDEELVRAVLRVLVDCWARV
jgi:hypothetical protein